MKRFTALLLFCAMLTLLCACGQEEAVSVAAEKVDGMIESVGYVNLEKEAVITAAEEAYEALSEADKQLVKKHGQLVAARQTLEQKKADSELGAIRNSYAGVWVQLNLKDTFNYTKFDKLTDELYINPDSEEVTDEYKREHLYTQHYLTEGDGVTETVTPYYVLTIDDNRIMSAPIFTLEADGTAKNDDFSLDSWEYTGNRIILSGKTLSKAVYEVVTIAGLPALYFKEQEALLFKKTDVDTFLSTVFVKVDLDEANANDYFQFVQAPLNFIDATGSLGNVINVNLVDSKAYDTGLIFFASSNLSVGISSRFGNTNVDTKIPFGAALKSPPDYSRFGAVTGTIWFIRSEYAQVKFVTGEKRLDTYRRSISFFDGLYTWKDSTSSYYSSAPTDDLLF